ncbi:Txe/YoeB family addiction module toxin [Halotia branconii]|uniref:Endoribonuclease YoeB n=1 Tax=Halotia branconii CENA392 TaxID=1539056 RepID=A0AAJ6PC26_9CYAN|nr:Txe/YoeB family addiction module toxin [Halotia branconii]WGV28422.1 Txe/YoeB family addiction module toxin [Halotia branconii CENA392]
MRSIVFHEDTLQTYEYLRETNKTIHKQLFNIIKEMQKGDPTQRTGKPEALKYELAGYYSRRLSDKDRLIYSFDEDSIYIIAIGGHYE